jgi:hypothetical protein
MLPPTSGLECVSSVVGFFAQAGYKNVCHETKEEEIKKEA